MILCDTFSSNNDLIERDGMGFSQHNEWFYDQTWELYDEILVSLLQK